MLILHRSDGGAERGVQGQRWVLDRDVFRIGRDPDCDIVLPERVVSRVHARIERRSDGYYLFDADSKNGTFVNGEPLTTGYVLKDGDDIQIALRFRLTFVDAGATAPLSMELPSSTASSSLRLDDTRRTVEYQGKLLDPPLSLAQYRLLATLIAANGAVVGREGVIDAVWPESQGEGVTEQAIDALVRRLRERLAELDPSHRYIITVRGHGFRFQNPS